MADINKYPLASIRLTGELRTEVDRRVAQGESESEIAKRDLKRYYALLTLSLPTFEEDEALLICQALNRIKNDPRKMHLLWGEVEDEKLATKLRKCTPFECMAIADAVEQFWSGAYHIEDTSRRLREVGLVEQELHDRADIYHDVLQKARIWGKEQHPDASNQHHAAFANSVAYALTRLSGGYGGPSVREHAATQALIESGIPFQSRPVEEVYTFLDPIMYGPITDLHRHVWQRLHDISFDDDPNDLRQLRD